MAQKITIGEDTTTYERAGYSWDRISHSLEPDTGDLPPKDKRYFRSIVKFLTGKEIRLSNLDEKYLYIYMRRGDLILKSMMYPMLLPEEFIRKEVARYLLRLGLPISKDGLGWKYGPMGFQQQHIKQELIGVPKNE